MQNFLSTCKLREWNDSWSLKKEEVSYPGILLGGSIGKACPDRQSFLGQFLLYSIHYVADWIRIFPQIFPLLSSIPI